MGRFDNVTGPQTNVGGVVLFLFIIDRLRLKFSSSKSRQVFPVILESFSNLSILVVYSFPLVVLLRTSPYINAGRRGA